MKHETRTPSAPKAWATPTIAHIGSVASLTAALGSSSRPDQSEFPQIQAHTGSFDICINHRPDSTC